MSGGNRKRVISVAFNAPPTAPATTAPTAASHGSRPASFHSIAEDHGAQTQQRPDGQVDTAGKNDRRQREGEQADFDGLPHDIGDIGRRAEIAANRVEKQNLRDQDTKEDRLVTEKRGLPGGGSSVGTHAFRLR